MHLKLFYSPLRNQNINDVNIANNTENCENSKTLDKDQTSIPPKRPKQSKNSFQNLAMENKEFIINAKKIINIEKERLNQRHDKITDIIGKLISE